MTTAAGARSIAEIVAPFGRLPAGIVVLLADALLAELERQHAQGRSGFDLQPTALLLDAQGAVSLTPKTSPAPWLVAPEASAAGATPAGDLFSLGAVLLELLIGRRPLDAGSPEATAAFRARLVAPPPVFSLCPTIPGSLEHVLLALLAPDPRRRPANAATARAALEPAVRALHESAPGALAELQRDAAPVCARVHELQAKAEGARGAALVASPTSLRSAVVSLLRAHALLPGQPDVAPLLAQAANAGAVRGARPQSAELLALLAQVAAAEPSPPAQLMRHAATLHEQGGEPLEAIGLMKRALIAQPQNRILVGKLDELCSPAALDAASMWAAGGAWVVEPLAPKTVTARAAAIFAPAAAAESPVRQVARSAAQIYASVAPRSRLFLLALTFGALMTGALWVARSESQSGAVAARAQLDVLATQGADCPPGGRALLLQAWQAARLHEPKAIDSLIAHNEALLPVGTRCHAHALSLSAQAELARRGDK